LRQRKTKSRQRKTKIDIDEFKSWTTNIIQIIQKCPTLPSFNL
jgi:hypothetical protein